jgi:hypothetical protein
VGDQLFNTPSAPPSGYRLKPAAYQGAAFRQRHCRLVVQTCRYAAVSNRTSNAFTSDTFLMSHPAGATILWVDGTYHLFRRGWKPFVAMQGGVENGSGTSAIGKVGSRAFGLRLGALRRCVASQSI